MHNVLNNIDEPNTLMNDLLQGQFERGGTAAGRFVVNSTVGVVGLFDVAGRMGLEKHNADFGETLGRWGLSPGPYIYIPVLGPSNLRDGAGRVVDGFTGLLNIRALRVTPDQRLGVALINGLDTRADLDSTLMDVTQDRDRPLRHRALRLYATPKVPGGRTKSGHRTTAQLRRAAAGRRVISRQALIE